MAHRLLWAVAIMLATLALVAGCVNVSVPKGPFVVAGQPRPPSPESLAQVQAMDKPALEKEVLRLMDENNALRQKIDDLKRENKTLKDRYEQLENQIRRR